MMKKVIIVMGLIYPFLLLGQNHIVIPDTMSGTSIHLRLQNGQVEFFPGFKTNTIGYNHDILGPTLILNKGSDVEIKVENNLSETTTLHWHGLHVSPENDGGPHTIIEAGQDWLLSFKMLDNAATYWYHPHLHEHTEEQVTRGAAGFIIVRDDQEAQLNLPRTYGVDDIPIVIQSRSFDVNRQFVWNTSGDDNIMVNGTLDAYIDLPAQVVRLRLLNGSTERVYNLGFGGNLSFYQIATDGGLLNEPVPLSRLRLVPGERAEILLDLSTFHGNLINLMSFASELPNGIYGASNPSTMPMGSIAGYDNNILNGNDFSIMTINVTATTSDPVRSIPSTLVKNHPYPVSDVDEYRNLIFQPSHMGPNGMLNGPFEINGQLFDLEVVNYEIPLNNTEVWELTNHTAIAHPFHIHDVQFYVLDINGSPPPVNMQGRKDVVLVPPMFGTVRIITRFEDFADEDTPYMFHCHMLSHEDDGMMGQFLVMDNTASSSEKWDDSILIHPNPTSNMVSIQGLPHSALNLYNTSGNLLETRKSTENEEQIDMSGLSPGVYFIKIITPNKSMTYKIIKN